MLQFLHPLWFAGLATLLIPLIIHLWNRQESRLIRVGSIRWLKSSEIAAKQPSRTGSRSLRNLQLNDLLLFFIRCLLLVLLVLLMAEPHWLVSRSARPDWVMFSPELAEDKTVMQKVDSLRQAGYMAHFFSPGFTPYLPEAADTVAQPAVDGWTLLRELEQRRSEFNRLVVYVPASLAQAQGKRPLLSDTAQILFIPVIPVQAGDRHWLSEAIRTPEYQLNLRVGITNSRGTYYEQQQYPLRNASFPQGAHPGFELAGAGEQWKLRMEPERTFMEIKTEKPLKVLIRFEADRREDAAYLENAVASAGEFLQKRIDTSLREIKKGKPEKEAYDFIFHLSTSVVEDTTQAVVVSDATGRDFKDLNTWVQIAGVRAGRLLQRVAPREPGEVIWTDGFGMSLLQQTSPRRYVFYSRFHPMFCTIAEEPELARWMLTLLFPGTPVVEPDRRAISPAQLQPAVKASTQPIAANAADTTSLHMLLWALLLLCFLVERGISSDQ